MGGPDRRRRSRSGRVADALIWLEEHPRTMHPFINGEFARFMDEMYFESINPRDGKPLARIVQCGERGKPLMVPL